MRYEVDEALRRGYAAWADLIAAQTAAKQPAPAPVQPAKVRALAAGEVLVLVPVPAMGAGDACYYPGGVIPTLPESGRFVLAGHFDAGVTFDPWPGGDFSPGLQGWEWGAICDHEVPRNAHAWQVVVTERAQLARDHHRTAGKVRFAAGEVLLSGPFDLCYATVAAHAPPSQFVPPTPLEMAEARWKAAKPVFDAAWQRAHGCS